MQMSVYFRVSIYGSFSILVHLTEVDNKLPFSSTSMFLLAEFAKVSKQSQGYLFLDMTVGFLFREPVENRLVYIYWNKNIENRKAASLCHAHLLALS